MVDDSTISYVFFFCYRHGHRNGLWNSQWTFFMMALPDDQEVARDFIDMTVARTLRPLSGLEGR